jgi:hypothetical protein
MATAPPRGHCRPPLRPGQTAARFPPAPLHPRPIFLEIFGNGPGPRSHTTGLPKRRRPRPPQPPQPPHPSQPWSSAVRRHPRRSGHRLAAADPESARNAGPIGIRLFPHGRRTRFRDALRHKRAGAAGVVLWWAATAGSAVRAGALTRGRVWARGGTVPGSARWRSGGPPPPRLRPGASPENRRRCGSTTTRSGPATAFGVAGCRRLRAPLTAQTVRSSKGTCGS